MSAEFMNSQFGLWSKDHNPYTIEQETALGQEALAALVKSVNVGEITSLDGTKTPLAEKICAFHGVATFEMNSNWVGSPQNWECPCCGRTKFQISRIGKKRQILAKLVIHHDHMNEALKAAFHAAFESAGTDVAQVEGMRLVEKIGHAFAAYEEILICEDCNNADTEAKKQTGSPKYFSFSVGQIRKFITWHDHNPHEVDAEKAQQMWDDAKSAYELRMKLIQEIARAAATNNHWYEPFDKRSNPIPVLGIRKEASDFFICKWVSSESLLKALGGNTRISDPNLSRWRMTQKHAGAAPPANFLAMLCSEESHARQWNSLNDDWKCPVCKREKFETVYLGDKGKVVFQLRERRGRGRWSNINSICTHCGSILSSLKQEVSKLTSSKLLDSYSFVTPDELSAIITARPHSPHLVISTKAAQLVGTIVSRQSSKIE